MYMDPLPWIGSSSKELGDVFPTFILFILWYVRSLLQLYFILHILAPLCTWICRDLYDVQALKCHWSAGRIGEVFLISEAFERL